MLIQVGFAQGSRFSKISLTLLYSTLSSVGLTFISKSRSSSLLLAHYPDRDNVGNGMLSESAGRPK